MPMRVNVLVAVCRLFNRCKSGFIKLNHFLHKFSFKYGIKINSICLYACINKYSILYLTNLKAISILFNFPLLFQAISTCLSTDFARDEFRETNINIIKHFLHKLKIYFFMNLCEKHKAL